jgi:hypothetical protein
MIDITLDNGYVTFYSSVIGVVASQVESCEVVDEISYHLGTNVGVFLININQFSVNQIEFNTSTEAVNYILNN